MVISALSPFYERDGHEPSKLIVIYFCFCHGRLLYNLSLPSSHKIRYRYACVGPRANKLLCFMALPWTGLHWTGLKANYILFVQIFEARSLGWILPVQLSVQLSAPHFLLSPLCTWLHTCPHSCKNRAAIQSSASLEFN